MERYKLLYYFGLTRPCYRAFQLLLFGMCLVSIPIEVAQSQSAYGILVDFSDSMNRRFEGANLKLFNVINNALRTGPFRASPIPLTPGAGMFPEGSWLGMGFMGGLRTGNDRSCEIAGYFSYNFTGVS